VKNVEKMRFHWEKQGKTGSFTVTASSVDECIKVAEEEIKKAGAELMDWHSV
jgi:hypothetical protein